MPKKTSKDPKPSLSDAEDENPHRRGQFLRDLRSHRHRLSEEMRPAMIRKMLALTEDPDPHVRWLAVVTVGSVRPLITEADGQGIWEAMRSLFSRDDIKREAREALRRVQNVLPKDVQAELVEALVSSIRKGRDADGCAVLLGQLGRVIPEHLQDTVMDTLLVACKGKDPLRAAAVSGLARLARHFTSHVVQIREVLLDAIGDGVFGGEPKHWEKAYSPLRHAPEVVNDGFVSRVLDFSRAENASTRLYASVVLRYVRPAIALESLPACYDRILDLTIDPDAKVRGEAEGVISEFLLSLTILPEAEQTAFMRRLAVGYARFDVGQRSGLMMTVHTLHEILSEPNKGILLEALLPETNNPDPQAAAFALHTAAAIVVGCRQEMAEQVVRRNLELGRTGADVVKGEASESWGDLLDVVTPEKRMMIVTELLRLASEGVEALFGDPWSILETNRNMIPVEAVPAITAAFLRIASDPDTGSYNLAHAATTVNDLVNRFPLADWHILASNEQTDTAFKCLLARAKKEGEVERANIVEAFASLYFLLPLDRSDSIIYELDRLLKEAPLASDSGLDFDEEEEAGVFRTATVRAIVGLLPFLHGPAREAAVSRLMQQGAGTKPEPEALAGLIAGSEPEKADWAINALLRLAQKHRSENVRCGAIEALGKLQMFPSERGGEIASVLIDLIDEVAQYVPGTAIEAVKLLFPKLPSQQQAILDRLLEALDLDDDTDAARALADLGAQIPDVMRTRVVEILRRVYENSAGSEDDWRFGRALRDFAKILPSEERTWLWSVRLG